MLSRDFCALRLPKTEDKGQFVPANVTPTNCYLTSSLASFCSKDGNYPKNTILFLNYGATCYYECVADITDNG